MSDVLRDEPGITLVGVGVNGRDGVERIAELKPHVVVLDVEMPEMTGHEALAEIRRRGPSCR